MKIHFTQRWLDIDRQALPNDTERSRLFHATKTRVDKFWLSKSSQSVSSDRLTSTDMIERSLLALNQEQLSIYILLQQDSWARIEISYQAFTSLMSALNVFNLFWSVVYGFGFRHDSYDENSIDVKCGTPLHGKLQPTSTRFEICYNLRYFALHGRPHTKTIWSERQAAVYQSFDFNTSSSSWIFIQPSEGLRAHIKELYSSAEAEALTYADCMCFHVQFASELATNWRPYINYHEARLAEVDEKALWSRVGDGRKWDYSLTFRDAQTLERIRRKLVKASLILKSNIDVVESLGAEFRRVCGTMTSDDVSQALITLRRHVDTLRRHERIVESLLDRLTGTTKLLFHILEYRQDEKSIQTSLAIKDNGDQLRKLTEHTITESDLVTKLTREVHEDSKFVKIFTFIALLYTPASLVATILSSNLVQVEETTDGHGKTYMTLVSDFWKFPLLSAALIVLTLFSAFGWRKYPFVLRSRIFHSKA